MEDKKILFCQETIDLEETARNTTGIVREFLEDQIKKETSYELYLMQNPALRKSEDECNDDPLYHLAYKRVFD